MMTSKVKMSQSKRMTQAKVNKKDEFYTLYEDIHNELQHYIAQLKGKVVYLNCDNPNHSQFWQYFKDNFQVLQLKELIATHIDDCHIYRCVRDKGGIRTLKEVAPEPLDFRSETSQQLLQRADVVVTNPPFSLFRAFITQMFTYQTDFLILGNNNMVSKKEVFPYIKNNQLNLGYTTNKTMTFKVPKDYEFIKGKFREDNGNFYIKVPAISWYTTLDVNKENTLVLNNDVSAKDFKTYDNYDIIEVPRISLIPDNYDGLMGVPITYLGKHDATMFELHGTHRWEKSEEVLRHYTGTRGYGDMKILLEGKELYDRVFIKRKGINDVI